MKHQITLEDIGHCKTILLLASSSREMKKLELRILLKNDKINSSFYVIQKDLNGNIYFEDRFEDINFAIEAYNSLDCINN